MAKGPGHPAYQPPRHAIAAVLYGAGASAPVGRPRWASWGAGVVVPGAPQVDITVVAEGSLPTALGLLRPVNLTRLAAGVQPPGGYRLVSEA